MNKPEIELVDVVRRFVGPYKQHFSHIMLPSHHRALQDITGCMTEAMDGGRYYCHDCHETFWSYHGYRNRSCPKCHGRQMAEWLKCLSAEILPCRYFHLVATVPSELRSLFLRHQKTLYGLLLKIAGDVVRDLAAEKRYVGAEVGIPTSSSRSRLTPGTGSGVRTANPTEQVRTLSCNIWPVTFFRSLLPITG